ncbi:MAG: hypothetical protein M1115_02025 [Actinobacteria bacterium]|nr:hypothetical protein [Actinomycetota bacterium]
MELSDEPSYATEESPDPRRLGAASKEPDPASTHPVRRYLVVANQTLPGAELAEVIRQRVQGGPASFYVVVPVTHSQEYKAWEHAWSMAGALGTPVPPLTVEDPEGERQAVERLRSMLTRLHNLGIEAEGELGDPDPLTAISEALGGDRFDEVILSTLPPGISRWLGMDLPSRVSRRFNIPVTTVTASPAPTR